MLARLRTPRRAVAVVTVLAGLALAAGCGGSSSEPAPAAQQPGATIPAQAPGGIDTPGALALVQQGALVIDVREQAEWDEGHLPQARLIPVGELGAHLAEIEQAAGGKDKPIVVYCRTGGRSRVAKQTLERAGFTKVVNGGGYRAMTGG